MKLVTFSPTRLLHVVLDRPLSSCATHFDSAPCLSSSCIISCIIWCCPAISSWPPLLLFQCTCMFNIVLEVASHSFLNTWPYHVSRLFLSKVSLVWCWLLFRCLHSWCGPFGLASSPSQHSHGSGVWFLGIAFLDCPAFRPVYYIWIDYGLVDIIFELDGHLLIAHDSWHFSPSIMMLHYEKDPIDHRLLRLIENAMFALNRHSSCLFTVLPVTR